MATETISAILGTTGLLDLGVRFFTIAGDWVGARITTGITEQDALKGTYLITVAIPATAAGVHWDSTATASAQADEIFDSIGFASIAAAIEAESTGSGVFPITVTVTDGTNPLQNATVALFDAGVQIGVLVTNASGNAAFSLNAGTYTVALYKGGYQFTPLTRTVTGSQAGTLVNDLEMTITGNITPPADPTLCLLYGFFVLPSGAPAVNVTVEATLVANRPSGASGSIVTLTTVSTETDVNGYAELEVIRTDQYDPTPTYRITCRAARLEIANVELAVATQDINALIS